jgi:rhodanese-related sulfurtransferase
MTAPDVDQFVDRLLSGLGTYPPYFHRLREVNRSGPTVYGVDLFPLPIVSVGEVDAHLVVDVRRIDRFAAGHLPGSISIELRPEFGTWLGWLVEPERSLLFVLDPDQNERELVRQALNVGHEALGGRIELAHWTEAGGNLATIDLIPPGTAIPAGIPILDVRQTSEWQAGHVPGAVHIELGDLATESARGDGAPVVHCGHGQRAMTAASLLARAGQPPTAVTTANYSEISRLVPSS